MFSKGSLERFVIIVYRFKKKIKWGEGWRLGWGLNDDDNNMHKFKDNVFLI